MALDVIAVALMMAGASTLKRVKSKWDREINHPWGGPESGARGLPAVRGREQAHNELSAGNLNPS